MGTSDYVGQTPSDADVPEAIVEANCGDHRNLPEACTICGEGRELSPGSGARASVLPAAVLKDALFSAR